MKEETLSNPDVSETPNGEQVASDALLDCPFCGGRPERFVKNDILFVKCPRCVSVGFHNHVRFGCQADAEWNERAV